MKFEKLEQIQILLENALDAVVGMSAEGFITDWNRQAELIFGWSKNEAIGRKMSETIIPPRYRKAHDDGLRQFWKTGEGAVLNKRLELFALHKDGFEFPVELSVTPIRGESGISFYAFLRDIHERKKSEAALLKAAEDLHAAKEEAEAANQAKSAFLANMSHEIRTPLGAIIGFSELVVDPQIRPSEKANYIAAIKRNGELLSNIVNDILDLSRVEAGKLEIIAREAALAEILTDTKTLLDLQASEKGIRLGIEIADNVPEIIRTDPLRLRQVLINIIGNAIKFTSRGSVEVAIMRVPAAHDGQEQIAFVVRDTGKGISPDQVRKLFAPFSQADATSKRKYGGTGLGLVLSKRLANLLGGDVVLTETEFGRGSTFTVTIDPGPIQFSEKSERRASENLIPLQSVSGTRLDGVRVLLADDAPDNQILVSRVLKLAGAVVEVASNGKEAIEKVLKNHYDVLLMDLQMPVMDGYEATAELRNKGYSGTIVALTAHALSDERERCLKSGFDDHLSKPINRAALIERIANLSKSLHRPLSSPGQSPNV